MEDLFYKLALNSVEKVGAVLAKELIRYFGTAKAVFQANNKELYEVPGIGTQIIEKLRHTQVFRKAEGEMENIQKNAVKVISFEDELYPEKLKNIRDAPYLLFYKGSPNFASQRIIGIVGTRKPSPQGILQCEQLVEDLKKYKPVIISGLAYGIDICAHRKALEQKIPTWGIMAHGHQYIYPSIHKKTAAKMEIGNNALITEYSYATEAERVHFPLRNRIVAGLCDALIVIETAKRGGSMITAELANNYNRDVFAFPGRISDLHAQGCNHLIKTHKAFLLEKVEDIAYIMRWEEDENNHAIQKELFEDLSEEEKNIVALLRKDSVLSIDQLVFQLSIHTGALATMLLNMELKGLVRSLPGNRYTLLK